MTIAYSDVASEQLPITDTILYVKDSTVNSSHVISFVVNNPTATATTITVNVVKSGDSAATKNEYITAKTIPANTSVVLHQLVNMALKSTDFISAKASVVSTLNVKFTIKEITA